MVNREGPKKEKLELLGEDILPSLLPSERPAVKKEGGSDSTPVPTEGKSNKTDAIGISAEAARSKEELLRRRETLQKSIARARNHFEEDVRPLLDRIKGRKTAAEIKRIIALPFDEMARPLLVLSESLRDWILVRRKELSAVLKIKDIVETNEYVLRANADERDKEN